MPTTVIPADTQQGSIAGAPGLPWGVQALGTPTTPAVGASPVTFTNATGAIQHFFVTTVAATTTTLTKRGVVIATALDAAANQSTLDCLLGPGEAVVLTYGGAAPVVHIDTP